MYELKSSQRTGEEEPYWVFNSVLNAIIVLFLHFLRTWTATLKSMSKSQRKV